MKSSCITPCDKLRPTLSACHVAVLLHKNTYSIAASDTGILRRFRSSCSLWLSSFRRRNFNSAIDCFLLLFWSFVLISYDAADILLVCLRFVNDSEVIADTSWRYAHELGHVSIDCDECSE